MHRNLGKVDDIKVTFKELFTFLLDRCVIIEDVECIQIFIFGVDAVSGKTAAQTVGAVVHHGDGINDIPAVKPFPILCKDSRNGTARRDPHLAFL